MSAPSEARDGLGVNGHSPSVRAEGGARRSRRQVRELFGGRRRRQTGCTRWGPTCCWRLRDCNRKTLSNLEFVQETLKNAALEAKATIVEVAFHEFSPFGISGMVVIAESHLAIHTWPEYGYAAVDVFTCGDLIKPQVAAKFLIEKFQSKSPSIVEMKRGILGHEKLPHKVTLQRENRPTHDRAEELQVVH